MQIHNFAYNGFCGQTQEGLAPYTAEFKEWTDDPGIFVAQCSDSKERLIPSFAIEGNHTLPKQDMSNRVYFGPASQS